ncbi:Ribosomal RNA large subunit methyltransferase N [Enhygromyxa salina]|uniref:Ribosomal RNA large subunit methyltransferase N n=1 Tax=Enhygromyxa salina TaxID=215803 RepID=A0A0C2D3F2_9BACT|nr:radical SAM protein [Enhygromyxa salina]KIG16265.1 Ribosomal RNA large subunit methyltransferase N [Enhygromyxa salina]
MVEIIEEHRGAACRAKGDAEGPVFNRRYVVQLEDGAAVESVLYRGDSLCVSSQVGCAVGCPFCASGANGLSRNLELDELIGQVEAVDAAIADQGAGFGVRRVTVSGVGEPLHNPAVPKFVSWCRARSTPASITTSGGPLRRLGEWLSDDAPPHNGISLSIHAGNESTRARTVPRGPALDPLFELLRERVPSISGARRRKLALAYLLLADLNDDDDELDAFLRRAEPLGLKIHLYSYNPVPTSTQSRTNEARYEAAFERMRARGLDVRRSSQARIEDNGGCGTLVALRGRQ